MSDTYLISGLLTDWEEAEETLQLYFIIWCSLFKQRKALKIDFLIQD